MFEEIKSWFSSVQQPTDKGNVSPFTMQQPSSPTAPAMNQTVSEQPGAPESMTTRSVHLRGGGEDDCCCCCDCFCGDCCGDGPPPGGPGGPDGPGGPGGPGGGGPPGW
ncbi:hypothetical protein N7454_011151 [Penicillium verhagenii]|nr:hypothetical protein N7454_011309 [Penicillium verhagenii]KAJ5915256.1 hypothetical protein N7454_011151 [Penicillium verhagenii]